MSYYEENLLKIIRYVSIFLFYKDVKMSGSTITTKPIYNTGLIALLNASLNNYDDVDKNWVLFITDHKEYLKENSNLRTISPSYMQGVRFNIKAYK